MFPRRLLRHIHVLKHLDIFRKLVMVASLKLLQMLLQVRLLLDCWFLDRFLRWSPSPFWEPVLISMEGEAQPAAHRENIKSSLARITVLAEA